MWCYRKILRISYKDHVINEEVRAKIQQAIRPHEDILTIVKRRKLQGLACSFVKKYNISTNLIRVIKNLYDKATSVVLFNSSIEDWFRTTFGVRQGCLLSPTLFNIYLEKIMTDALQDHEGTVGIGGRTMANLRFAGDIDG